MNETHDPLLRSWVESANAPGHDFPIQNLPFGVFRRAGRAEVFRGGVAIGECIVDLGAACERGIFDATAREAALLAARPALNDLMAAGNRSCAALRLALSRALRRGSSQRAALEPALLPQARPLREFVKVDLHVPGCPPPAKAIAFVLGELLEGRLPELAGKVRFG